MQSEFLSKDVNPLGARSLIRLTTTLRTIVDQNFLFTKAIVDDFAAM